jgi:prepilin-type N-terminal cleavage/methylation domain-containing protein
MKAGRIHRDDAGFTLPELLVALVVMGIITPVLASAFITGYRTTTGTTDRLAASNDAEFTSSWFIPDVQSAESFSAVDVASCPAPGGSTRLFTLLRTVDGNPVVTGYAVMAGPPKTLERYTCTSGVAGTTVTVAHNLAATGPAVTCTPSPCGSSTDHVSVTVTAADANGLTYTYALNAERRQA